MEHGQHLVHGHDDGNSSANPVDTQERLVTFGCVSVTRTRQLICQLILPSGAEYEMIHSCPTWNETIRMS